MRDRTGSIFERDNGFVVKYKGRQYRAKTKTEAKLKLRELQENSIDNFGVKTTIEQMLNEWLYGKQIFELKPVSFDRLEISCRVHVIPYFGRMQVYSLTVRDVEKFIATFKNKDLSYSTAKKAYEALNGCLNYYVDCNVLESNPISRYKLSSKGFKETKDIVFFDQDELEDIFKAAEERYGNNQPIFKQGSLIRFIANTGLRAGEAIALTWDDIDFDNNMINVHKNYVTVKNRDSNAKTHYKSVLQTSTKTKSGMRRVPINKNAKKALLELKEINKNSKLITINGNGKPMSATSVDRMFKKILNRAGYSDKVYGVHSLRHSFATNLLKKGVDIKQVSELLGHKDVNITYNTYIHFLPSQFHSAVSVLD